MLMAIDVFETMMINGFPAKNPTMIDKRCSRQNETFLFTWPTYWMTTFTSYTGIAYRYTRVQWEPGATYLSNGTTSLKICISFSTWSVCRWIVCMPSRKTVLHCMFNLNTVPIKCVVFDSTMPCTKHT